jgi:4-amino-4-deoxy-L-arabinose transferase-like glycosyltransferase
MLMALALKIGGESAVYMVVPICAGLIVVLTYLIGARFAGPRTGFLAAVLLTCSPMFLFESLEPMSDIPGHDVVPRGVVVCSCSIGRQSRSRLVWR